MGKRIAAMAGVVMLVLMSVLAMIFATIGNMQLFTVFIGIAIFGPMLLWVFIRLYDRSHPKDAKGMSMSEMRKYAKRIKKGEDANKVADEILEKYGNEQVQEEK